MRIAYCCANLLVKATTTLLYRPMPQTAMANERHSPSESEERVLEVFKEGRDAGEPWGRANPLYLRERTGMEKSTVEYCLRQLTTAGWLRKVAAGLYEFDTDPRAEADD